MCTGILPIERAAKGFQACFEEDGMTILDTHPLDPAFKKILDVVLDPNERVEMATRVAVKEFFKDIKDDIFDVVFNIIFPIFLCTPRKERIIIGQSRD